MIASPWRVLDSGCKLPTLAYRGHSPEERALSDPRPILLTGIYRSGSTWTGHMIAASPHVAYVHEPFNFPLWPSCPLDRFYACPTEAEQEPLCAYLRDTHEVVPPRAATSGWLERSILAFRARPRRPLLKDPFTLFATEWLARTYSAQVIVLIRHPAAFAASLKRLGWSFDFSHFLRQQHLLHDRLLPFRADVERHAQQRIDIVDDAILLWRMVYHEVRRLRAAHPDFLFLRHEDLSRAPLTQFRLLFRWLGLPFEHQVRQTIEASTSAQNPRAEVDGEAHRIYLNSRANIWSWCQRLEPEEIERIRRGTEDVAPWFYADADWEEGVPEASPLEKQVA
jgi:hypothetical protein